MSLYCKALQHGTCCNSDESTSIASRKELAIVVRFYCDKEMRMRSKFFKLVDVLVANAETLYNVTINKLENSSIPIENIIGYAADTANVMFGQHNSVITSRLRERIPNLFAVKCIYSAHLCASYACAILY